MIFSNQKSDNVGAIFSAFCVIHCVATPYIFLAQSSFFNCCDEVPVWWKFIDYFFLAISFIAVYRSTQTTTKNWIKPALWVSWLLLFVVIINEKLSMLPISENFIYVPTFSLIALHLYNKKYCQCNTDTCCANER